MTPRPALLMPLLAALGCATVRGPTPAPKPEIPVTHPAAIGIDDPRLGDLLEEHWEGMMSRWTLWATELGDHRFDDRLPDTTPEAWAKTYAGIATWLELTEAIEPGELSDGDKVTWSVLHNEFSSAKAKAVCHTEQWQVSPMGNAFSALNRLGELHPIDTPQDGENLLSRYRAVPAYIDGVLSNLKLGIQNGRVPNAENVRRTIEIIESELGRPESEQAMYAPALQAHPDWAEGLKDTFSASIRSSIETDVRPAFTRYRDFLRDTLLPASRGPEQAGVGWMPEGEACYEAAIREHTTLDLSAEEIHATGLKELEKIHAEFEVLGKRLWGIEDVDAIFERLRTDETLFFETPQAVQDKAAGALARAQATSPEWFGILPKAPCVVVPIPEYQAQYSTIAYYRPPSPDGTKPGEYFINTTAPQTRPRHEAEVLAYHEAVPGHHLQIAIAQELGDLPMIRRHIRPNAYIEGWALYTERLADEMGLYSSDLDRLGMLSFDAWRASRLVVDTGLHAKGWTRKQAIAFMLKNTPLAENNISNEVDRYISWPGQALSYKIGQLEIRRLRAHSEHVLGERFKLSDFHDAVLKTGAVPLSVLRRRIEDWTQAQAQKP